MSSATESYHLVLAGNNLAAPSLFRGCGLNENGPCRVIYLNTLSPFGETVWEEVRKCDLVGRGMSLETGFGISKRRRAISSQLMLVDEGLSAQQLLQHHVCLPAAAVPVAMGHTL